MGYGGFGRDRTVFLAKRLVSESLFGRESFLVERGWAFTGVG